MIYLITFVFAGQTIRLSTEPTVLSSDAGDLLYSGGVASIDYSRAADILTSDVQLTGASVEAILPLDTASLVQSGYPLTGVSVELSVVPYTSRWEDRDVLLVGTIEDPTFGAVGEPTAFSFSEAPYEDTATLQRVLPAGLFAAMFENPGFSLPVSLAEAFVGSPGPYVVGVPGVGVAHATKAIPLWSTGLIVGVLVADHHVQTPATVEIYDDTGASQVFSVENRTDAAGHPYAGCWFLSVTTLAYQDSYDVRWDTPGLEGDAGERIRGVGDWLIYLLRRTNLRVDYGRFEAIREALNAYRVDTYLDEQIVIWEYIRDSILPIIPVSLVSGPDGLYPVLWPDETAEATGQIDTRRGAARMGPVETSQAEIRNKITIEYRLDAEGDATAHATAGAIYDGFYQFASSSSLSSQQRWGVRPYATESNLIADRNTAALVALRMAQDYAEPRHRVSYAVRDGRDYRLGELLLLTDPEIGLSEQRAVVEAISVTGGWWSVVASY